MTHTPTIETNLLSDNNDKTITYTSSNPNIASVDENGVVTAKERGNNYYCSRKQSRWI